MTLALTPRTIKVHCEDCGHWRTRHQKGFGCLICAFEIKQGMRPPGRMCKNHFVSRLPQSEIDQARAADKNSYERSTRCATCLEIWCSHDGMLCPNGETVFVPLLGGGA